eukprot:EG_transcript_8976
MGLRCPWRCLAPAPAAGRAARGTAGHSRQHASLVTVLERPESNSSCTGRLHLVVLTGGPAAGKSSSLQYLRTLLEENGYAVFHCTEKATSWSRQGTEFPANNEALRVVWQREMFHFLRHSEDSLIRYAEHFARTTGRPVVVLFDRGLLDPRAFISEAEYEALLRSTDMTWDDVGKNRYSCVIHLDTVALQSKELYNRLKGTNAARRETAEEAIAQNVAIRTAWAHFPYVLHVQATAGPVLTKLRDVGAALLGHHGIGQAVSTSPTKARHILARIPEAERLAIPRAATSSPLQRVVVLANGLFDPHAVVNSIRPSGDAPSVFVCADDWLTDAGPPPISPALQQLWAVGRWRHRYLAENCLFRYARAVAELTGADPALLCPSSAGPTPDLSRVLSDLGLSLEDFGPARYDLCAVVGNPVCASSSQTQFDAQRAFFQSAGVLCLNVDG